MFPSNGGVPVHVQRDHTVRAKIIDACGLTCTFCHNEGTPVVGDNRDREPGAFVGLPGRSGRVSIYTGTNGVAFLPATILPDAGFATALAALRGVLDLDELHLTGGEPTLHPKLPELIALARDLGFTVGMTSNGENGARVLPRCAEAGLDRVNFSIFGTTPAELAQVQDARYRNAERAQRKITALRDSVRAALDNGVKASANIVVPDYTHRDRVMRLLEEYSEDLSVRLLNSLDEGEESVHAILRILDDLHAVPVGRYLIAGVSGSRTAYRLPSGRIILLKEIRPVRLPDTCRDCRFNNDRDCQEGYYGVRLYRDRAGRFLVGVCIQRMDLCLPLDEFVISDLRHEVALLRQSEYEAMVGSVSVR